jgi:hypothetical protein
MPTMVDFPTIVKDAVHVFGDLFANEPERRHFAAYLTGLLMAEKKDVCPSGAHSPIAWRRFRKQDAWETGACKDHTELGIALLNDAIARDMPGDVTFDSSCTSAKVLNHIPSTQRAYVGDLTLNRKLIYDGREQSLQAVPRQMPWAAKQPGRMGNRRSGDFRKQRRIPDVTHPVMPMILHHMPFQHLAATLAGQCMQDRSGYPRKAGQASIGQVL